MTATIAKLIKEGAIIIDVRSPAEFAKGANPKSVNIPLDVFASRLVELHASKTYVLCCASGGRSGMAEGQMKSKGFKKVFNAGPWKNTIV